MQPSAANTEANVLSILEMLPSASFIRRYIEHFRKRTEAHVGYQFCAALSCLTQTAPAMLAIPYGADLFSNSLFLLIGASGRARKSTAVTGARRILSDSDFGVPGAFKEAIIPSDIASSEGVQDMVFSKPRRLIAMEEFGEFLQKTSGAQHAAKRSLFNNLFDAVPLGRIRVDGKRKDRNENSTNPRVSAFVGCAPQYLVGHTRPLDWTGGFMSRWLTFYGDDERKLEPGPPDKEEIQLLVKLLQVKERAKTTPMLFCAGRTPSADALWQAWTKRTRNVIEGLKDDVTKAVLQRAETHALKIALLIAWDLGEAYLDGWRLTARALAPALRFANCHIRSVARIVEEIPTSEEAAERARVLCAIAEEPNATSRKVVLQTTDISSKQLRGHVETLHQAGLVSIHGSEDAGLVAYAKVPVNVARTDHYSALDLFEPDIAVVHDERAGETALAKMQLDVAVAGVEADSAEALDVEL